MLFFFSTQNFEKEFTIPSIAQLVERRTVVEPWNP